MVATKDERRAVGGLWRGDVGVAAQVDVKCIHINSPTVFAD